MKRTILGIGDIDFPEDWDEARIEAEVPKIRKKYKLEFAENNPLVKQTYDEAIKQGVNPHTMIRIFNQESGFNPKAKAKTSSAKGIAQLIDSTAKSLGVTDPHDPDQAIPAGVKYFKSHLDRFEGDERKAIAAYHDGPTQIAATGLKVLTPAGADYLAKVYKPWANTPGQSTPAAPGAPSLGGEQVVGPTPQAPVTPNYRRPEEYTAEVGPEAPTSKWKSYAAGAVGGVQRGLRGLGIPLSLARLTGMRESLNDPEESQRYFDYLASRNPGYGTAGDISSSLGMGVGAGKVAKEMFPMIASPLGRTLAAAGLEGVALTPGGIGDRALQAHLNMVTAGGLHGGLSIAGQPFKMRPEARDFMEKTTRPGEQPIYPPLTMGAQSKFTRDATNLAARIPVIGAPVQRAEAAVLNRGARELWERATPPTFENPFQGGPNVRGQAFAQSAQNIADAEQAVLRGKNFPISANDLNALTVSSSLLSAGNMGKYQKVLNDTFFRFLGGQNQARVPAADWQAARRQLQDTIRNLELNGLPEERQLISALKQVAQGVDTRTGQVIGPKSLETLAKIDEARLNRDSLVTAAGYKGSTPEIKAGQIESGMRAGATPEELATSTARNQDIIAPMEQLAESASITKPLQSTDVMRRQYPMVATALLAGKPLGMTGLTVPAMLTPTALGLSSGKQGVAKILYGETTKQKQLADLVRKYPSFMGAIVGEEMQPSFRTRYDEEDPEDAP